MLNRTTKTRLHIRSIKTAPAQLDVEIAELFTEMRQATGMSREQLSSQFKTRVETIDQLEQGNLSALPSWNETSRVIFEYTNMLGLDPEPVLRRVMVQLPGDHPKRPKTQSLDPSYDNMQSNVSAVMNRVPEYESAVENPSLPVGHELKTPAYQSTARAAGVAMAGRLPTDRGASTPGFSAGYGEMRAIPSQFGRPVKKNPRQPVANRRRKGVFVLFIQFVLLLIILGTGYVMWLAMNDPQAYESLKSLAATNWDVLMAWVRSYIAI